MTELIFVKASTNCIPENYNIFRGKYYILADVKCCTGHIGLF